MTMPIEEVFSKIETLLPLLQTYRQTGSAEITADQGATIQEVVPEVLGRGIYSYSCSTCVLNYMHILESWYHREKKKQNDAGNDYEGVGVITSGTPMDTSIELNPYGEDYRIHQPEAPKNKRGRKKKVE